MVGRVKLLPFETFYEYSANFTAEDSNLQWWMSRQPDVEAQIRSPRAQFRDVIFTSEFISTCGHPPSEELGFSNISHEKFLKISMFDENYEGIDGNKRAAKQLTRCGKGYNGVRAVED